MTTVSVVLGDITTLPVDAIVNAANSSLMGGGGVDGAIHLVGGPAILDECKRIVAESGPLPTGRAVITTGGHLPARFVIHTVGPIWGRMPLPEATRLLASCYSESLDLAAESGCRSIAFPNISTGVYGFPRGPAAETAVGAVGLWVEDHPSAMDVITFVCFNEDNLRRYEALLA